MSEASSQADHTDLVSNIIAAHREQPGALLPILHALQDAIGYVPSDTLPIIASGLNLSRAEVHGVVTFYHYFRSSLPGRHTIQICRAEACQAMGSRALEEHARRSLDVDFHQTTGDGEITLMPVYCLGNCACSPTVRVADRVFSHVDAERFDEIVKQLGNPAVEVK